LLRLHSRSKVLVYACLLEHVLLCQVHEFGGSIVGTGSASTSRCPAHAHRRWCTRDRASCRLAPSCPISLAMAAYRQRRRNDEHATVKLGWSAHPSQAGKPPFRSRRPVSTGTCQTWWAGSASRSRQRKEERGSACVRSTWGQVEAVEESPAPLRLATQGRSCQ
jgi:hypothetical protein